jgi:hypothetical protein
MNTVADYSALPVTIELDWHLRPQLEDAIAIGRSGGESSDSLWERLLTREDAPDKTLEIFCDLGLYLDQLGHRAGPRWLLERLAERHGYPEAILTLMKEAYASPDESLSRFKSLLQRHGEHQAWLIESLARTIPSSKEKETAFLEFADAKDATIRQTYNVTLAESVATESCDCDELRRLYELGEPRVFRALAGNPATPAELLMKLLEFRNGPLSRVVRGLAKDNLQRQRDGAH